MKNNLQLSFFSLAIVAFTLLNACTPAVKGSGPQVTKKINISEFKSIELELPASVTLAISDTIQGVIRAQANIAELIEFKMDGDELTIRCNKNYKSDLPVEVILTTRQLEEIEVKGSGDLKVVNPVKGEKLEVEIDGSGDVTLMANVGKLETEVNGSGDVTYSGKAEYHHIRLNGSGNIMAGELQSEECDIKINGSGDADLNITGDLNAKVTGSGKILYAGTPKVNSEITGSGEIKRK